MADDERIAKLRVEAAPVVAADLIQRLTDVVERVRIKAARESAAAARRRIQLADLGLDDVHVLGNPPVVVLAELLHGDDAGRGHRRRRIAAVPGIREAAGIAFEQFFVDGRLTSADFRSRAIVVTPHALDGERDDVRGNFQAAIHGECAVPWLA
ncbi:MAG: hypothetical protein QM775_34545 [Pirellulales bacterium]